MPGNLALFDLDNTLLAGDSDHAFGEFAIAAGLVDEKAHRAANDCHYQAYLAGKLDIHAYVDFAIAPVKELDAARRQELSAAFVREVIAAMALPKGRALVDSHRARGDRCVIITATNSFVAAPIAGLFGVEDVLATELELAAGFYTGRIAGTPCFQAGKLTRLGAWLRQQSLDENVLGQASFYSDSSNDLPLLEAVGRPVAVDPDARLSAIAARRGWQVMSLR